ncbi:MAG: carbonic anhydrase/acetyltransferase-like protein (isoleucine patch superfamily) [Marinoscillum sp.]|jgi:carbonic anhydrase/acetyltransferase-like protein (isoleucine patch superfamily)
MALIKSVRGFTPKVGKDCWFAENATIVGEVILGDQCTVWFGAVLRGDVNYIKIGDRTNVQDNVTIHGTFEKAPTTIGSNVSIGHNAIIHGCTLEDDVLIGMGAMVMDGAVVKSGAIVAAGAVVLAGTIVESNSIYGGIPAKKIKELDEKNKEMLKRISNNYLKYAGWFKDEENEKA